MRGYLYFLIIIVVTSFVSCQKSQQEKVLYTSNNAGKIAYVNIDSLMQNYQFAKDLNEEFTRKQENMTADLNVKAKKVEEMMKAFQYKIENNGFATRKRAESEQQRIEKKRQELVQLNQSLQTELTEKYQAMVKCLQDTISNALEIFNQNKGFDLILRTTKAGNVLYGKPELDITKEFLKQLNDNYKPSKEATK